MELYASADRLRVIEARVPGNTMDWERIWTGRRTLQEARYPGTLRIAALTRKFLPHGSRVLDGGCGLADKVLAFDRAGIQGYGVDTAQDTLARAKEEVSSLRLVAADVRALPFADNSLDGYWSLGVLEHFFDGFDAAAREIRRTLRPGGYLFLSVPSLNVIKSRRLARGRYGIFRQDHEARGTSHFWQYYFSDQEIIAKFASLDFQLVLQRREGAYYGLKNDFPALRSVLQWIEDRNKRLSRLVIRALNLLFNRWAYHTTIFVLRHGDGAAPPARAT
jgi:SAM-dependent methyltransferase